MAALPRSLAPIPGPGNASHSLREHWLGLRNRLIASRRFQRWAAAFPLTRPVARRNARALFDLVAGFVYSQILAACVRLKLFEILSDGPLTSDVLAPRIGLTEAVTLRLLKAASALRLTESLPGGRFGLGPLGAALQGNPSLGALIGHHALLYADLSDPVALLRGEVADPQLAAFWAYAGRDAPAEASAAQIRNYSTLMAESQALVADDVLDAYPVARHGRLLDIGGGEGVFLTAAAARHAGLSLMLFDLPAVAQRAALRFQDSGLSRRASVFGGDFFRDELPKGADIVSLVRVLHDHDDARAALILSKAFAALPKGGVILVAEPMAGTPGSEPVGDAYFGMYLTAMGSGRPRTAREIAGLLHGAGFRTASLAFTPNPMVVRVMSATV
jgi:demethylspheroidene O-methyltransferase